MSEARPPVRRPYESVRVEARDDGHVVLLDAKPLRSPAGTVLRAPSAALAAEIAREWSEQPPRIDIARAPLTRLLGTALDRVPANRAGVEEELAAHAQTELVCHRADHPPELAALQARTWQPLLEWFARSHDAPLRVTTGVIAIEQPGASLAAIRRALAALDDLRLTGLSVAVGAAGSLVIGAALVVGRIGPAEAFDAAELDASFQIARWGEDEEAARRRAQLRADLALADRWSRLLPAGSPIQ
jgi:chaperone required for assembly of F1-ATPase